ncbi:MAG: cell division protein FtsZ [Janthinobacterium lividum]
MTLNLTIPQTLHTDFTPRITVIGVGGGGTNAVDNMIALDLQGVDFVVANTDAQQLTHSRADRRIQLGPHLTQGLGAGAKPEIGRAAAEEASEELARHLEGAHMVFITAGMGGGTGTGAAPVIARMARERGILTVGVVTKPFTFEGGRRAKAAEAGLVELQSYVDTLIVIPNQNLFRLANERTGWKEAFKMADHVLYMGVRGVTDLMVTPGMVNLDFADIRTVMAEMGKAMMGTGEADGDNRAVRAAEAAISNPLLEDTSMAGARGLLINITGGEDMTLFEVDQAANRIREEVADDANIIFGSAIDEHLTGRIRVSVVATGIESPAQAALDAQRPRLVAVGGGAPVPMPAMALPQAGGSTQFASTSGGVPVMATTLSAQGQQGHGQAAAHGPVPLMGAPVAPAATHVPAPQPAAAQRPVSMDGAPRPAASAVLATRAPRSPLFNDAPAGPAPAPAPRSSLFGIVTGAIRSRLPAAAPESARSEPAAPAVSAPAASVRPAVTEEMGLDIPAFLRRQTS